MVAGLGEFIELGGDTDDTGANWSQNSLRVLPAAESLIAAVVRPRKPYRVARLRTSRARRASLGGLAPGLPLDEDDSESGIP